MATSDQIKKQWAVRRKMAISAYIFGLVIFPIAYVKYPQIKDLAMPYYTFITFVLTAYYSFSTWQDVKNDS